MENQIKQLLKENKLYNEDKPLEMKKSNNPEQFLKTFSKEPEKKQRKIFTENIERNKDGFIILESMPFLYSNKTVNAHNDWLLFNNGARVLLKKAVDQTIIEQELLIMYFLKSLNISCANYEPVLLNGESYLVTPSFLGINEKLINPYKDCNKIEQTYEEAKNYNNEIHYLKTIFVDRIYGNYDRFPNNYGIIVSDENAKFQKLPKNCPLFDNAEWLLSHINGSAFPRLKNNKNNLNEVIRYLISNEAIMHWVINPMKKTNLQEVANRLKKEKGLIVSDSSYKKLEQNFKDSETIINDELKAKGKKRTISLT